MKRLTLSAIGCGNRVRIYMGLAAKMEEKYNIVAAADPDSRNLQVVKDLSNNPDFKSFDSDKEFLAAERLSDVVIIGTQDNYHYEPCKAALIKGYDVLLEKPISPDMSEVLELQQLAEKLGRKMQVCYVLRYTPFYRQVKEVVESGILGDIISVNASEGVEPWHQAHSYVRGNWRRSDQSSPMIVAKCTHDMDILGWIIDEKCLSVSSYGSLEHFRSENAPAGAPKRCTDGCPHRESCHYDAHQYAGDHRTPWLAQVHPNPIDSSDEEVIGWLKKSPYGRCVYHCDNNVVDHQVVSMEFEAGITANLTMTAFEYGRSIEIFGTKGILKGGRFIKNISGKDIHVNTYSGEHKSYVIDLPEDDLHMGGDDGIIDALFDEMSGERSVPVSSYIQSHIMAYAAEESRIGGMKVKLNDFIAKVAADQERGE
jgi:predicted dehydrogenase